MPEDPGPHHGTTVIVDIADFSLACNIAQHRAATAMWDFIASHQFPESPRHHLNPTGDGALVAFESPCFDPAISFARDLIAHMRRLAIRLRAGLHVGPFRVNRIPVLQGQEVVVGSGPNDCARVVSLAEPGQIVASEDFVRQWASDSGDGIYRQCAPRDPEHPIEVFVKHDRPQRIRLLVARNHIHPRSRIAQLDRISKQLKTNVLQEIESVIVGLLADADPQLTRASIDPRLSILAPLKVGNGTLCCTDYRYHHRRQGIAKSETLYGPRQGPPGKAHASGKPCCVRGLPDPEEHLDGYVDALRGMGMPPRVVRSFGRKARTFMAIPFGLDEDLKDCVLCVDIMNPLVTVSDAQVENIALRVQRGFFWSLPAMWRLRTSSR